MPANLWRSLELALTGPLPSDVRANMRVELMSGVLYGPFQAIVLFIPVVLQRMGAAPDQIALYQSETYLGFLLSAVSVLLVPRRGVVWFLAGLWAFGRAAFLLVPAVPTVTGLLILAAILWTAESLPSPAYMRVLQQIYPARERGLVLSVVRLGMAAGMLAFTPVAGKMLDTLGPSVLFPIAALFGVASAGIFTRIKFSPDALAVQQTQPRVALGDLLPLLKGNRAFVLYLLSISAFGLAGLIPTAFYPAVLVDRLHLSYTDVSMLGLAQTLCWLAGYLVWGRLITRIGSAWTLRIVFLMMLVYPFSHIFAESAWVLVPAFMAAGISSAGVDLAFTNLTIDLAEPGRVAEYAALQRTTIGLRGMIGPLLGVWLNTVGMSATAIFCLSMALYLLASGLMFSRAFRRVNV